MTLNQAPSFTRGKQSVSFGNASSGVRISYTKCSGNVHVSGWYDHMVGIEGGDIALGNFLEALGVPASELRRIARHAQ